LQQLTIVVQWDADRHSESHGAADDSVEGAGLLAFSRPFRRAFDRIASLSGPALGLLFGFGMLTRLVLVAPRCTLLMGGVSVILRLKMLGLVLGTFAIPVHDDSCVYL
jgi:hypothetical protein